MTILVFVWASGRGNPQAEMTVARKRLTEAELIRSSRYARRPFQNAWNYYDSAMREWKKENGRFFLFRNFDKTREYARQADILAVEAIETTRNNVSDAEDLLGKKITFLENQLSIFDQHYGNFPFSNRDRNALSRSKLLLKEGIQAYNKANYSLCRSKLDYVDSTITILQNDYDKKFNVYLSRYEEWEHWIDQGVNYSRKHKTCCVIVDKYARKAMLYKNGHMIGNFEVELGANWIGDKNQQGDKSTPEGKYKITGKLSGGATLYHKALVLNYPNDEDKKRFLQNIKNGLINPDARIGGHIEIHGEGGKGTDWTDGCIAFKNEDMDRLYDLCTIGTQIIIVGSAKRLEELFEDNK